MTAIKHSYPLDETSHDYRLPDVIALCGPAGSGKSTIAAELCERHGYVLVKFAGPLKAMLRALGLSHDEIEGDRKESPCALLGYKTPRHAMQTLGTEWGRDIISPELWVNAWMATVDKALARGLRVVVDDCRFANELQAVHELRGCAVRLYRRGAGLVGAHSSEAGLQHVLIPEVDNNTDVPVVVSRVIAAALA